MRRFYIFASVHCLKINETIRDNPALRNISPNNIRTDIVISNNSAV